MNIIEDKRQVWEQIKKYCPQLAADMPNWSSKFGVVGVGIVTKEGAFMHGKFDPYKDLRYKPTNNWRNR